MPRPKRILYPGAYYHVYNRGVNKMPIVFDDQDRRTFFKILSKVIPVYKIQLFAYCLMENHFHFFCQTIEANLNVFMWDFLRQFSTYVNLKYKRVGPLFQGRYQSKIVDTDIYALQLTRYIHWNPVEAGVSKLLEDYSWSSYGSYVGKQSAWNWLNQRWILQQFHSDSLVKGIELFSQFHKSRPQAPEIEIISSWPPFLGDKKFKLKVQHFFSPGIAGGARSHGTGSPGTWSR